MSDFAPFVAATIKDKVVDELVAENQRLQQENDSLKDQQYRLAITGRNGSPVYSVFQLRDENGNRSDDINISGNLRRCTMSIQSTVPLDGLSELEIHVGTIIKIDCQEQQFVFNPNDFPSRPRGHFIFANLDMAIALIIVLSGEDEAVHNIHGLDTNRFVEAVRENYGSEISATIITAVFNVRGGKLGSTIKHLLE